MTSREARSLTAHVLLGLGLSVLTMLAISEIDHLDYSRVRDLLSDILTYPGALISSIFYPQGVHTGRGSPGWAYVAIAGNTLFYLLVWFFIVRLASKMSAKKTDTHATTMR